MGCAIKTDLGYGPRVDRPPTNPGSEGKIAVAKFADARDDQTNQVGRVHNLYGMPLNAVEANQSPVIWVTDGMARALAADGFQVEKVESPATAGDLPVVTGTLKEAFLRTFIGGAGAVVFDVDVVRDGSRLFSTHCEGGKAMTNWASAPSEFRNTLAGALDEAADQCVPKLLPVLKENAKR